MDDPRNPPVERVVPYVLYGVCNPFGQWSIRVASFGLQVDSIHRGEGPHLHLPNDYDRPVALGPITYEAAHRLLTRHLERFDEVNLDVLVQELTAR